jgi:hypothetical protein
METQNQKQLLDSVEPPPGLASRTCAKIWAAVDHGEQNSNQNYGLSSGTFLDSAYFSPETVLPAHFLLYPSEPDEVEPKTPKVAKRIEIDEDPPPRSSHGIGLIASVSVGIVIAGFLFPMIRYAERSTRSYVTDSWMNEINRRVDQYEQIHGTQNNELPVTELPPYNLALSGWQELHSEILAHPSGSANAKAEAATFGIGTRVVRGQQPASLLPDGVSLDEMISEGVLDEPPYREFSYNPFEWFDSILLVIQGQESSVRSAYGQAILFKDGRVFFRSTPNAELLKK